MEQVVERAGCCVEEGELYAVEADFLVGESVVNIWGAGAVMGTKPSLPCPECSELCRRCAFVGDGR